LKTLEAKGERRRFNKILSTIEKNNLCKAYSFFLTIFILHHEFYKDFGL